MLRVVENGGEWLRVQVPTRPNGSTVWVRAEDFELGVTDVWVEISIARTAGSDAGQLWVYKAGAEVLHSAKIVSGRPERPTPRVTAWVDEIIPQNMVGPVYGSWIVGVGAFSEALGTFNGDGVVGPVIHGTNRPEVLGMRVSSSEIRLMNETMDLLVAIDGIIGAPVHIHAGPQLRELGPERFYSTRPAITMAWSLNAEPVRHEP